MVNASLKMVCPAAHFEPSRAKAPKPQPIGGFPPGEPVAAGHRVRSENKLVCAKRRVSSLRHVTNAAVETSFFIVAVATSVSRSELHSVIGQPS